MFIIQAKHITLKVSLHIFELAAACRISGSGILIKYKQNEQDTGRQTFLSQLSLK